MIIPILAALLAFQKPAADSAVHPVILLPDAVWDGVDDAPHRGWGVLVRGIRRSRPWAPPTGSTPQPPTGSS